MGRVGDAAAATEGGAWACSWSSVSMGEMGTAACGGGTRRGARATHEEGWDHVMGDGSGMDHELAQGGGPEWAR